MFINFLLLHLYLLLFLLLFHNQMYIKNVMLPLQFPLFQKTGETGQLKIRG
jgi:hypothetical protein